MPILPGKGVEGQRRDTEFAAALNDPADRFGAGSVPEDAGEPSSGGPSAVAIHDDGNMLGWLKVGRRSWCGDERIRYGVACACCARARSSSALSCSMVLSCSSTWPFSVVCSVFNVSRSLLMLSS